MERKWIDITQPLTNTIASWPGDETFEFKLSCTKEQTGSVNIGHISTSVHTGTHVDAPYHFDEAGKKIDEIDINMYIGPAKLIDVTAYEIIDMKVLEKYELDGVKRLLLKTENERNPKVFPENFTVIDRDAGDYLRKKGIVLLGTDAPSVDPVDSKSLKGHHSLAENGIYILENLLLNNLMPGDYELIALPLRIVGADGSPVRAVIRPLD
ncbi:arylformamidase [Pseudogracilibacillus sp. SE30717A]|uniref:arylformamidase n=1 Tax=Pseudogracilibacillus sp. SE30717A TaxID=3098293 RepID=UPI00300DC91E